MFYSKGGGSEHWSDFSFLKPAHFLVLYKGFSAQLTTPDLPTVKPGTEGLFCPQPYTIVFSTGLVECNNVADRNSVLTTSVIIKYIYT